MLITAPNTAELRCYLGHTSLLNSNRLRESSFWPKTQFQCVDWPPTCNCNWPQFQCVEDIFAILTMCRSTTDHLLPMNQTLVCVWNTLEPKQRLKWIGFSFCFVFSCFSRVMTVANVYSHWSHLQCSATDWNAWSWVRHAAQAQKMQHKHQRLKYIGFSFCSVFSCFSSVMTVANVWSHWSHLQCSESGI